jgi:glycine dehydrogenase subunit 2
MRGIKTLSIDEPLIFERGRKGRKGFHLPKGGWENVKIDELIPKDLIRDDIKDFPELSEVEVFRHFFRLSQWNYSVDSGMYPLGSCTMKYNPKINEYVASLNGFLKIHPYQDEDLLQGALELMYELELALAEISGMDRVTLIPAAGAHGEFTGMNIIRKYHLTNGNPRKSVIIPDTAHGTNPASSAITGYNIIPIKSNEDGVIDPKDLKSIVNEEVAAIMITNPNTLGIFEEHILEISKIMHEVGGLVYCDGANLNALIGQVRLGDMGIDVIHFNLHKTFATPHGGGGPGSGAVGVKRELSPFLPIPIIVKEKTKYRFSYDLPLSIGRIRSFYGNFSVMVRAYAYIKFMGAYGLKKASDIAVLNANYILSKLKGHYHLPYDRKCMHECVFTDKYQRKYGINTLNIAKRLIDYGFHPPTIYFPLVVHGAIMIEPTETEAKENLDEFIEAMIKIAKEVEKNPEKVLNAPVNTKNSRLDEVKGAREPRLRYLSNIKEA